VRDAVLASGVLERHPEINLETQAFGIFGQRAPLDARWWRTVARSCESWNVAC